jgi:hypothetical protein
MERADVIFAHYEASSSKFFRSSAGKACDEDRVRAESLDSLMDLSC